MPRLQPDATQKLLVDLLSIHTPEEMRNSFELFRVVEKPTYYLLEMREKINLIPAKLRGHTNIVQDGFCNPITLLSQSFSLKKIYLKVFRRRWKLSGSAEHESNEYTFQFKETKLTESMALFFEDEYRVASC